MLQNVWSGSTLLTLACLSKYFGLLQYLITYLYKHSQEINEYFIREYK